MSRASTMRRYGILVYAAVLVAAMQLSGCVGMVIGGAATAGVAAYQERGIKGVAQDTATATKVRANMLDANDELFRDVGIEVYEGRVLLTGRVPTEERRAEAVKIAWGVSDVKDVINEVLVSENPLSDIANDSWITTQLKSKMTFDKDILAINYSIETVGAVIYLIGIAQDDAELQRVINHARGIKYVKRVVSHVRVKSAAAS
ncbi:MAG: BON domain-containing protein [Rhodospirillales bacterium]|nr:BON domain-containing protein [Rhodospirillales bacterium]MBO6787595.1 BON domain-containing protein [Rhodospirillales bacterium]